MKQNNHNTNTPIMLDYMDSKNLKGLLQYEAHIRLMYKYAIASFMFIVMVCFLPGCVGIQTIYPDSREFARVCKEAREKGELVGILYDEGLQPNSDQNFAYLYRLYGNIEMGRKDYMFGRDRKRLSNIYATLIEEEQRFKVRKDYIFGKDRTESNIFKKIINADKKTIHNIKEEIKTIHNKKEYVATKVNHYGEIIKKDKKTLLKDLEQELFLLENYYGETIEQRIDKESLITQKEFLIRNKKTQAIAFKSISYNLYADRGMYISSNKDPAKVEYNAKPGYNEFIEVLQYPLYYCFEMSIIKELNETK
ncbi:MULTISPECIES: hypothetical protein [Helicobacter]|uniref:Uncharacterized protein n=3 Tax=Helicobacter TaxID=209 RepID=A0A6D2C391_9HELI|nr:MULTISPECIES: hypothetical protein [Helicobacter]EMZ41013.1 hypothetical protein C826_00018 [Helicobacter bilis WiWa]TLE03026.1 hypothetical protein LS77_009565 [Helicobacter bilis]TLE03771.1 hypothetical protein LS76_009710 [Helicobacter bilis]